MNLGKKVISIFFSDRKHSLILLIRTNFITLVVASCLLLLGRRFYHLVHFICKLSLLTNKMLNSTKSSHFQILICSKDPNSCKRISQAERDYLKSEMGQLKRHKDLPSTPWKRILSSSTVIAYIIAQVT